MRCSISLDLSSGANMNDHTLVVFAILFDMIGGALVLSGLGMIASSLFLGRFPRDGPVLARFGLLIFASGVAGIVFPLVMIVIIGALLCGGIFKSLTFTKSS